MWNSVSSTTGGETVKTEQGEKQTLPLFRVKLANYYLTRPILIPIPTHTDYWQKFLNKYASRFQPKELDTEQKRERGSDVPNEQANNRCCNEEDPKDKKVIDIGTRRDKAPTSFQIADKMVQKAWKAIYYPRIIFPY
jgi:hypothetical protein